MGATNFNDVSYGHAHTIKGMEDAYASAVSEAQYMEGHDAYSGTIATTSGVSQFTTKVYDEDSQELRAVAVKALDAAQKWGPALAIPVREVTPATWNETSKYTLKLSLPVEHLTRNPQTSALEVSDEYRSNLHSRVLRALRSGKGDLVQPAYDKARDQRNAKGLRVMSASVRVGTSAGPTRRGAAMATPKVVYLVSHDRSVRHVKCDNITGARAEAKKQAAEMGKRGVAGSVSITPMLEDRGACERYVAATFDPATCRTKSITATVEVTVGTMKSERKVTGTTGWMFVGWAAC